MILRNILVLLVAFAFLPMAQADDESPFAKLLEAESILRNFDKGADAFWDAGDVNVSLGNFGDGGRVLYTDIDHKENKAKSIGNAGQSPLFVLLSLDNISFIERTGFGNTILTTIFGDYASPKTKKYIAVTSRHSKGFLNPIPSQYHGTCVIVE